jgi:hypothetical protein
MKRSSTIIGLLLVLLIAGNGCNSRHYRQDMRDSEKMMRTGQNFRHHREYEPSSDTMRIRGIRRNMWPGWMEHRRHSMRYAPIAGMPGSMDRVMRNRMMRGMGPMRMDSIGWIPMGIGRRMMESIPNVTDNQKKQIEDLIKKQHDEMKKAREEMTARIKSLLDSHRKEMLNILTDEQKKFIKPE